MIPCVPRRSVALGIAVAAVLAMLSPASALATFPGRNGKIAFVRNGDIWAINADGSGLQQLTTNPAPDMSPAWNADGTQIAFVRQRNGNWDLYRYVIDGPNPPVQLTTTDEDEYEPAWSPDGRIGFLRVNPTYQYPDLRVVDSDGTGDAFIRGFVAGPDWSPDGSEIAFGDPDYGSYLQLVRADGTDSRIFPGAAQGVHEYYPSWAPSGDSVVYADVNFDTGDPVNALKRARRSGAPVTTIASSARYLYQDPSWSPDGNRIAFSGEGRIWTIAATGGAFTPVTREGIESNSPAWQPLKQLNPAPSVSSLSPASVALGSGAITLIVNGSGFVADSRVRLNGEDRPTTVVSASRLLAEIPASDLDLAGEARVTVSSPSPGGGVSASRVLTIQGPVAVSPPRSLSAPAVSGGPRVGEILSCSPGTWSNAPTGFAFAWLRQGVRIPGADAATRQVTAADAGQALACRVEATNAGGTSAAVSEEILVASEQPVVTPPVVSPPVVIGGGGVPAPVVRRKTGLIGVGAPSAGRVGASLRLTATFTGTPAGRVVLQRKVRGRFVNATSLRPGSARVALTFTPQRAGLLVLRVRYASGGVMRLSRNIVIRVRPA